MNFVVTVSRLKYHKHARDKLLTGLCCCLSRTAQAGPFTWPLFPTRNAFGGQQRRRRQQYAIVARYAFSWRRRHDDVIIIPANQSGVAVGPAATALLSAAVCGPCYTATPSAELTAHSHPGHGRHFRGAQVTPPTAGQTEIEFFSCSFLSLGVRYLCFPFYSEFFSTLLHNDPAAHQDHYGRCRIRTRHGFGFVFLKKRIRIHLML